MYLYRVRVFLRGGSPRVMEIVSKGETDETRLLDFVRQDQYVGRLVERVEILEEPTELKDGICRWLPWGGCLKDAPFSFPAGQDTPPLAVGRNGRRGK